MIRTSRRGFGGNIDKKAESVWNRCLAVLTRLYHEREDLDIIYH